MSPRVLGQRTGPLFLSTADFKNGMTIEENGVPFRIMEFLHVKPGKGSAFVRTKMKNLLNGNVNEKTWRAGESVTAAEVFTSQVQYSYDEPDNFVFMDSESFEELRVDVGTVGDLSNYLLAGLELKVTVYDGKVIDLIMPNNLELTVTECAPPEKGNTQGKDKPATLETGVVVTVPAFIESGTKIKVDPTKGEYVGRA